MLFKPELDRLSLTTLMKSSKSIADSSEDDSTKSLVSPDSSSLSEDEFIGENSTIVKGLFSFKFEFKFVILFETSSKRSLAH